MADKSYTYSVEEPNVPPSSSSFIGAVTAGGRSMVIQFTSFYLRAPMKIFRPAKYDYTYYLRVLSDHDNKALDNKIYKQSGYRSSRSWFWNPKYTYFLENSSIGVLTKALNKYGWKVLPDRVLPPLLLNSAAGVVLYTTYLSSLSYFGSSSENESGGHPAISNVLKAGFLAGTAQAIASAPIDAIYTRSSANELLSLTKKHSNLWQYGIAKFKEIGLIGCFGGFGLSFLKESLGFAVYFTTFEFLKGQACSGIVASVNRYRELKYSTAYSHILNPYKEESNENQEPVSTSFVSKRELEWFQRSFTFVGGVTAAFFLQLIQYPMLKLQKVHITRLEAIDIYQKAVENKSNSYPVKSLQAAKLKVRPRDTGLIHLYYNSYLDTFEHIKFLNKNTSIRRWLYKGFIRNTLALIPGTTAGLLVLEYMRSNLDDELDVRKFVE
ncbi:uncharacterized protein Ecym_1364 [Eremothecium cymbalariae DBVPG|uniref:Mitochondrial carrier protein n=1 Tax=Eremothecium cymbalariae (strain CBS 270.75 / DBVPG 7215 / KCTC 17166 / NRRL Y-17582) TaxID=931890 RepID=G8JND3_ERECY|nr:hypothetical protein Ecym_1364 [Eremothecium cymbalariae DBVPG\